VKRSTVAEKSESLMQKKETSRNRGLRGRTDRSENKRLAHLAISNLVVDVVELATESNEGFFSRKRMSERPANGWSRRFPSLTVQQADSRVAVPKT